MWPKIDPSAAWVAPKRPDGALDVVGPLGAEPEAAERRPALHEKVPDPWSAVALGAVEDHRDRLVGHRADRHHVGVVGVGALVPDAVERVVAGQEVPRVVGARRVRMAEVDADGGQLHRAGRRERDRLEALAALDLVRCVADGARGGERERVCATRVDADAVEAVAVAGQHRGGSGDGRASPMGVLKRRGERHATAEAQHRGARCVSRRERRRERDAAPPPAVPTFVTVTDSVAPAVSIRIVSPAAIPVVNATLTFVSPAAAATNNVVLRDCVPTAAIVAVSSSTFSVLPTTKFARPPHVEQSRLRRSSRAPRRPPSSRS